MMGPRMTIRLRAAADESGVILIQVAIMLLVLAALGTYVIDYGVLWLSRGQAQNAADAGALSGAVARAYDDFTDPPAAGGPAALAAIAVAQLNVVWTEAPATVVTWTCPAGVAGRCVRMDVYRDGSFGSTALPTFFGPLLGVTTQGVRATATARVMVGNASNCMRPWAVADKWIHVVNPVNRFDKWIKQGSNVVATNPQDNYTPPGASSAGTGYTLQADLGTRLTLKPGSSSSSSEAIIPGWFLAISLPDGDGGYSSGGSEYREAIGSCVGQPVRIGEYLPVETGSMTGPTSQGFNDLVALDPLATWNASSKAVKNSCAPACAEISPRIVPVPVFDMDEFQRHRLDGNWSSCPTGGRCVRVVNILGFFVASLSGKNVIGYLSTYPAEFVAGAPTVHNAAGFLRSVHLVR